MRQSKLFSKTTKDISKDELSINAQYLIRGGFVDKTMAGVYTFLPLGLRVLNKIENIVREEMDKIGTEMLMPALSPKSLWEQSGRLETIDVLMKTSGANKKSLAKNDHEYILNCTHEDVLTPIAAKFNTSYKDLPFAVYQIQTKFRNEPRAKSGILRGREFRMKDLYSFHESEKSFKEFYEQAKETYAQTFERLGLGDETYITLASGGDFTKDNSHEFQTRCETGEDLVFRDKELNINYNKEIAPSRAPLWDNSDEEEEKMQEVEGKGMIGVEALAKYLKIPVEKTTKTIIFETSDGRVIAAAVRGDYDINEEKLRSVSGVNDLKLATEETVKKVTGAEVGYAGVLNLPKQVEVYLDDSMIGRKNFECGANRTDYHSINVNFGHDLPLPNNFYDIKVAKEGDLNPSTGKPYEVFKAAEIGNIFPLNTKFPDAFNYTYTDKNGKAQKVYMGSYGIGTSRIMGVLVEKNHDANGVIWPKAVAPFQVHLVQLGDDEKVKKEAEKLYSDLLEQKAEVLYDDRIESIGAKLKDADLIGIPVRVVVSSKSLDQKSVEVKLRGESEAKLIKLKDAKKTIQTLL